MDQPIEGFTSTISAASPPKNSEVKSGRKRAILFSLLALAVTAAGAGYWVYWKQVGSRYVKTDNAYTAAEVALVTAEIDGPVAQVNVVDSQQVKRGDVLVVIDDTDTRLALRQAEADLARARAQVTAATADLERSGIDLKRREALVESGSVSGDELTRVKYGASDARAALDAARAAVALAQARVDKARVDLGRTVIRSPIDGVVARRQVQLGERVQPSTPLLSVVPVNEMYVRCQLQGSAAENGAPRSKGRTRLRPLWPQGRLPWRRGGILRRHRCGLRPDPRPERDRQLDQGRAAAPGAHPPEFR